MSSYSRTQRRLQAAEQAAAWLAALQSDELSSQERGEFIDWIRESPLHIAELLHAARLHRDLSSFKGWAEVEALKDGNIPQVVNMLPASMPRRGPNGLLTGVVVRLLPKPALVVPLLIISSAGIVALSISIAQRLVWSTISTQSGERREETLADGSIVNMAPDSELRVRLEAKQRLVWLDRGEALFNVEKDPRRPFIAIAENTRVRAVGTAFDVGQTLSDNEEQPNMPPSNAFFELPGWSTWDLNLTYLPSDGKYSITLFSRNLFNRLYATGRGYVNNAAALTPAQSLYAYETQSFGPPRTYGVILQANF